MLIFKKLAISAFVVLVAAGALLASATNNKCTAVLTDRGNWAFPWIEAILVFSYDPVAKVRVGEPVLELTVLSDPVEIALDKGDYEIVLQVMKYGKELLEISLGHIAVKEDLILDLGAFPIPFELFVPA